MNDLLQFLNCFHKLILVFLKDVLSFLESVFAVLYEDKIENFVHECVEKCNTDARTVHPDKIEYLKLKVIEWLGE